MRRGHRTCEGLSWVVALVVAPACFNPPSDGVDSGFESVAASATQGSTTGLESTTSGPGVTSHATADGSSSDSGPAVTEGAAPECGDGVVSGDEDCDDAGESATCDVDCTAVECGDGVVNAAAGEACDDAGESAACDADCTAAECGDGVVNAAAGEACDDAGESAACDVDCSPAECGDGVINAAAGEACDDGNEIAGDGCHQCQIAVSCSAGATLLVQNPAGTMVVCDDPTNTVCEQDAETLCPAGWGLCTREQHVNRNTGFDFAVDGSVVVVGEIHCRTGSGAGHYTIGPYDGITNLSQDPVLNCHYGSSRPSCEAPYGCNETYVSALCCAPTPTCGNGVVDAPEELCDDGNGSEVDACLNSCSWRMPGSQGLPNCG
jgi:cysteine-rich repeat protein